MLFGMYFLFISLISPLFESRLDRKPCFWTYPFPEKIATFDYDSQMKVLKVTKNGSVRWKSYYWVYVSAALEGKYIGALNIGNGILRVFYRNVFLGYFNENELRTKEKSVRLETNLV